jgi:hypothetical protein
MTRSRVDWNRRPRAARYDATYHAYRRLHPAIAPIIRDLAAVS